MCPLQGCIFLNIPSPLEGGNFPSKISWGRILISTKMREYSLPLTFFPRYFHPFISISSFPISPLLFPWLLILIEKCQNLRVNNWKSIQILLTRKEKYSKLPLYTSLVLCHLFMISNDDLLSWILARGGGSGYHIKN